MNLSPLEITCDGHGERLKTMQINATGEEEVLIMLFCLPNGSFLENSVAERQAAHTKKV